MKINHIKITKNAMKKIKVIQFGLGNMGSVMAKTVLEKKDLELVGAIVRNDKDNGKDISELIGLKKKTGIKTFTNIKEAIKKTKPDIMLHAAVSYVPEVWKQIKPAVESGINVITIAEEMGWPFVKYPKLCREMENAAKKHKVSILGSGINPGFAMDIMPLVISGICQNVKSIKVTRVIDFSPFGPAIQKNIGIGMSSIEFKKGIKERKLPLHIGLPESTYMLASGLKWNLDKVIETREAVIAKHNTKVLGYMTVKKGKVVGFNHRCFGFYKSKKLIILEELGRIDPHEHYKNTILIEGKPKLIETINVPPGNITTTSHAVNLIPLVVNAKPGLLSMLDIPPAPALQNKK